MVWSEWIEVNLNSDIRSDISEVGWSRCRPICAMLCGYGEIVRSMMMISLALLNLGHVYCRKRTNCQKIFGDTSNYHERNTISPTLIVTSKSQSSTNPRTSTGIMYHLRIYSPQTKIPKDSTDSSRKIRSNRTDENIIIINPRNQNSKKENILMVIE